MPQRRDAVAHDAPVDLELTLALAEPAADATARLLAHEVAPHAPQPREQVLELSELHLEPALVRRRMRAEDVEDEGRAVDDLDALPHHLLKVRLL